MAAGRWRPPTLAYAEMSPSCFFEFEADPITLGLGSLLEPVGAGRVSKQEGSVLSISLADRVRASRRSRSPVQDTVEEHFDEISAALADGVSFRDLHSQLTREGRNVGRGHSSLFSAYKTVKDRRNETISLRRGDLPERPSVAENPAKESRPTALQREVPNPTQMPLAVIDTRRKTTDW